MHSLAPKFLPKRLGDTGLIVERERAGGGTAYVRVRAYEDIDAEYDSEDKVPFPITNDTKGFLVEFNELDLLKEVIPLVANHNDMAVDDDHGNIILGSQFVILLQYSGVLPWLSGTYSS